MMCIFVLKGFILYCSFFLSIKAISGMKQTDRGKKKLFFLTGQSGPVWRFDQSFFFYFPLCLHFQIIVFNKANLLKRNILSRKSVFVQLFDIFDIIDVATIQHFVYLRRHHVN
jgi:hypothetical protein